MNKNKNVALFGSGKAGQAAYRYLSSSYNVKCFLDNDTSKVGLKLFGVPILHASDADNEDIEHIFVASEYFEQITLQLVKDLCIPKENITVLNANEMKSFSFGVDDASKEDYEKVLGLIAGEFNKENITYYVDAGTLLGVYRDGSLIPWDDDLDFAILATELGATKALLKQILPLLNDLTKQHWKVDEYYSEHEYGAVKVGNTRSLKLYSCGGNKPFPSIDFFVKYISGDTMDYTLASRGISMPSRHIFQRKLFEYKAYSLSIPVDTEGYLSQHYGDDWRTPKRDWNLSMLASGKAFE